MTTAVEHAPVGLRLAAARGEARRAAGKGGAFALAALPGALTIYLSFNAGGYFAGSQGAVSALLAFALAARVVVVRDPFGGFSRPLTLTAGALGFYSLWSLISSLWSHAPARALLDCDLANIYLFVVILVGSSARSARRVRWTVALTWLALLAVCATSVGSRLRPDVFAIPPNLSPDRLAFPLTYWNALGLFAVVGLLLGLHLASSTHMPRLVRIFATATLPVFAVTILLTFSRASLALGAAATLAYALLARPRGLLSAVLAGAPTCALALLATYHARLIANGSTTPAAVAEGRNLVMVIAGACVAAGLARAILLELDRRLSALVLERRRRRVLRLWLAAGCAAAMVSGALALAPQIEAQWRNFTKQDAPVAGNDVRSRIDAFRIGGRLSNWRIALRTFERYPLHGHGAGTYAIDFYRMRTDTAVAVEAHSLYLEAMSELGIVGLVTIVVPILVLICACFARARRGQRSLWIALGLVAAVWAIHAAVDWDWEMPAVTLPVFALGACALARRGGGERRLRSGTELGLRIALGLVALAAGFTAARISVSDNALNGAVTAFNSGNCRAATAEARASIAALSQRPQPYSIIGYCDVRDGDATAAVAAMQTAVARDPQDWNYLYGLALSQAADGRNPRPALARAERLDPLETTILAAAQRLRGGSPRRWRLVAKSLPMLVALQE